MIVYFADWIYPMSNLAKDTIPQQTLSGHDQTVQTKVEEGSWMYLGDAATATGVSERTLRRHVKKKVLKSRRLGKLVNSPLQVWITPDYKNVAEEETTVEFAEVEDFFEGVENVEAEALPTKLLKPLLKNQKEVRTLHLK